MTAASGCRAVEAGRSGLPPRIVLALNVGAAGRSAMRAARAEQERAVASSCGPGRAAP